MLEICAALTFTHGVLVLHAVPRPQVKVRTQWVYIGTVVGGPSRGRAQQHLLYAVAVRVPGSLQRIVQGHGRAHDLNCHPLAISQAAVRLTCKQQQQPQFSSVGS